MKTTNKRVRQNARAKATPQQVKNKHCRKGPPQQITVTISDEYGKSLQNYRMPSGAAARLLFASKVEPGKLIYFVEDALRTYPNRFIGGTSYLISGLHSVADEVQQLKANHPKYVRAVLGRVAEQQGKLSSRGLFDSAYELEEKLDELFVAAYELSRNPNAWDDLELERLIKARSAATKGKL